MRVLIVGDSQAAGPPGQHADAKLRAAGHETLRIGNSGRGPYDYVRMPELWAQYTGAVRDFRPDVILLVFGSNDAPGTSLLNALTRMKQAVVLPVFLSGPPRYPASDAQARGASIKANYQSVFGARFIDAYPYTDPSLPRAPDGLHFTREGGRLWGESVADRLLDAARGLPPGGAALGPPVAPAAGLAVGAGALAVGALVLWWALRRRRRVARNRRPVRIRRRGRGASARSRDRRAAPRG